MKRIIDWLFTGPPSSRPRDVLGWWEVRRVPFNLIVGAWAIVCLAVFAWAITASGHLEPGEDAVEPIFLMAAPVAINVLYTLGWLFELSMRCVAPGLSLSFGPTLLKTGMALGLSLIALPAASWTGYRLLQVAGFLA